MAWKEECIKRSNSVTKSTRQQVLEVPSIIPSPRRSDTDIKNGMNCDANCRKYFKSGIDYESKRRQHSVLASKVRKANRAELICQRRSDPPNFGLGPVTKIPRVGRVTNLVPTELNFETEHNRYQVRQSDSSESPASSKATKFYVMPSSPVPSDHSITCIQSIPCIDLVPKQGTSKQFSWSEPTYIQYTTKEDILEHLPDWPEKI